MRLISDFPWWCALLCLLCGVAYSLALYGIGRRTDAFSPRLRWTLAALRCVAVTLIALLLLAPMARRETTRKEKPIILVAQDNSQSILLTADSLRIRNAYAEAMTDLIDNLKKDYDVRCYTFGTSLREGDTLSYDEAATDMGDALSQLSQRYANRNVGALLLASDGIFNQGVNPTTLCQGLPYPIYTVGLGDTAIRRDARIAHLRYNTIATLSNQFPLEITVGATRLQGVQRTLTVSHNGTTLFSKTLTYTSADYSATEQVLLAADKPGLQTYTIAIAAADGEVSLRNNTRTITIEVLDGHQRVAILAAAPHPDVAALSRSLESNLNYEVESMLAADFKGKAEDYDLLILHNLPARGQALPSWMERLEVPTLFVLGSQTDLSRFNNMRLGLEINARIQKTNEVTPLLNNAFALFALDEETQQRLERFPPLSSPFGDYKTAPNTQTLFTARLGTVQSGLPLVAFAQKGGTRFGFVCGEGLWRWRMADYGANQSHDAFDALVNKMVTYTAMQAHKEKLHVECDRLFRAGEAVVLDAMLYDDNFEPLNKPELTLTLTGDALPQAKEYLFNRTANAYSLHLGRLDPGRYAYQAATTYNGQPLTAKGTFSVEALQLEDLTLVADHSLLNTLSQSTSGALLSPDSLALLPDMLRQRDDIKTILSSHTRYTSLLSLPWLFILIVVLLGGEWILRKYNGTL